LSDEQVKALKEAESKQKEELRDSFRALDSLRRLAAPPAREPNEEDRTRMMEARRTALAVVGTIRQKYAAAEEEMKRIKTESERLRRELLGLARADGEAFEAVLDAVRMPQTTAAETESRAQAMAAAGVGACRVPLQTAAACIEVIELATQAAKSGNRNAVTDAGVGGLLAQAAAEGALLNVQINLKSLQEGADKQGVEMDLHRLAATLRRTSEDCRSAVRSTIDAS